MGIKVFLFIKEKTGVREAKTECKKPLPLQKTQRRSANCKTLTIKVSYYTILSIHLLQLFYNILSTIWTSIVDDYDFKINIPNQVAAKSQKTNKIT